MLRYYYISDNLSDLEIVESELQEEGFESPQLHVLSHDDHRAEVKEHNVHEVNDFMKKDVVHSGFTGITFGAVCAVAILLLAFVMGWVNLEAGWTPFVFLAVIVFGFPPGQVG